MSHIMYHIQLHYISFMRIVQPSHSHIPVCFGCVAW